MKTLIMKIWKSIKDAFSLNNGAVILKSNI